jgi:NAD(P)-dependent dehydrogenase (short-subunit alcohol dehydrogenase family)
MSARRHDAPQTSTEVQKSSISTGGAQSSKESTTASNSNITLAIQTLLSNIFTLLQLSNLFWPYLFRLQPLDFIRVNLTMGSLFSTPTNPNTSPDAISMTSKVILITGANAGLGLETTRQLIAHHRPAKIILAARSTDKATAAIASLQSQYPDTKTQLETVKLDLSSLESVRSAAHQITQREPRLDVLLLNAGIMATPNGGTTQNGFEEQIGVNHLGHFYLTRLLLPLLLQTQADHYASGPAADLPRVIALTSEAHNMGPSSVDKILDQSKMKAAGPWTRYGASKALNVMFAAHLARLYPGKIMAASVHPGIILTDLYASSQASWSVIGFVLDLVGKWGGKTVEDGSWNSVFAVTSKDLKSGAYYTPVGNVSSAKWTREPEARKAWEWSERVLREKGFEMEE